MNRVCQSCQKSKATVHITDTAPKKRERHLCEDCAEKEGVIIKHPPPTTNAILKKFMQFKASGGSDSDIGEDRSCPRCGRSFREFQSKGLLGCPHDYEAFRSILTTLLSRAHNGATEHVGKVPPTAGAQVKRQTGLLRLSHELEDAIERENYERAAEIRDQIRTLEAS